MPSIESTIKMRTWMLQIRTYRSILVFDGLSLRSSMSSFGRGSPSLPSSESEDSPPSTVPSATEETASFGAPPSNPKRADPDPP